jgi:hypothetical protein
MIVDRDMSVNRFVICLVSLSSIVFFQVMLFSVIQQQHDFSFQFVVFDILRNMQLSFISGKKSPLGNLIASLFYKVVFRRLAGECVG